MAEGVSLDLDGWEFREDPDEVCPWIDLASTTALDKAIPDSIGLSCGLTPHKEPVLRSELSRSDPVFDEVVIDL